ncbi:hypothetical protein [uncultured Sphingomonas sp.]|uniref:hypothetical protein n=1 Tax=uncultured Sphingomonas sp. TaxID=158754 RepID=UPI0035CACADF
MADHLESVKTLAANYRAWASNSRKKGDPGLGDRQDANAIFLAAAASEIEELRRVTKPIPKSYGDINDLPPELLRELTGIKVDDLEQQLFNIINSSLDDVELDTILIELYRRHNVLQTRKFLQNKLWRMVQKGVIESVAGKKGVYSSVTPSPPTTPFGGFDDLDDDVPF